MNDKDSQLDNKLTDLTDALLEGRESMYEITAEEESLARVVRQLHETIAPDVPADAEFRERLKRRAEQEWRMIYRRPRRWYQRPAVQFMAMAASIVLVLAVGLMLSYGDGVENLPPPLGTAAGGDLTVYLVLAVAAAVVVALWVVWRRRK